MTIECRICGQIFEKQVTNKHLKYKHDISVQEYKNMFPGVSLISESLRQQFKERSKKANASRKGIPRSQETIEKIKKTISEKIDSGERVPWNKGKTDVYSEESLQKMRDSHKGKPSPFKGMTFEERFGEETADKIKQNLSVKRKNQKNAPENNHEIVQKIIKTSKKRNDQRRLDGNLSLAEFVNSLGFSLIGDLDDINLRQKSIIVECNSCQTKIERSASKSMLHERMCPSCYYDPGKNSQAESEIAKFIETLIGKDLVIRNTQMVISPLEIDIWIPSKNLAIEFCGLYWHSEKAGKSRFYHKHKLNVCEQKGIRLIQIFEDEWYHKRPIVEERLRYLLTSQKSHFGARNCKVKQIETDQAKEFLNEHHIQGYFGSKIKLGLFYQDKLVSVMTFSEKNITKGKNSKSKDEWEISRFASSQNIPGAASKIYEYFKKTYQPKTIFTYSDLRWNTGQTYERMGMKKVSNGFPNYWYVEGTNRRHRFSYTKKKLVELYGQEYSNMTERQIAEEKGMNRIWDCGSAKYEWNRNN